MNWTYEMQDSVVSSSYSRPELVPTGQYTSSVASASFRRQHMQLEPTQAFLGLSIQLAMQSVGFASVNSHYLQHAKNRKLTLRGSLAGGQMDTSQRCTR